MYLQKLNLLRNIISIKHAAAYALIAYQTAYLKTYYKKDFIAASISTELTNTSKLREFVEELRRLKIEIIRPSINKCFAEFKALDKDLLWVRRDKKCRF